jgi:hypothetical protein
VRPSDVVIEAKLTVIVGIPSNRLHTSAIKMGPVSLIRSPAYLAHLIPFVAVVPGQVIERGDRWAHGRDFKFFGEGQITHVVQSLLLSSMLRGLY